MPVLVTGIQGGGRRRLPLWIAGTGPAMTQKEFFRHAIQGRKGHMSESTGGSMMAS